MHIKYFSNGIFCDPQQRDAGGAGDRKQENNWSGLTSKQPGSIMRLKLATGSCPEENSGICPHQSKIKGLTDFLYNKKPIKPNLTHGRAQSSPCVCVNAVHNLGVALARLSS